MIKLNTLLNRLNKVFFKKKSTVVHEDGVNYIHHQPLRGNIGDYLCSPRHYFSFQGAIPGLSIVGGGVFQDFGYKKLKEANLQLNKSVLWGAGRSIRNKTDVREKTSSLGYRLWGLRDIDLISSPNTFLPCCSCLHPMLDAPLSSTNDVLVFINKDKKVTTKDGIDKIAMLSKKNNWTLLLNNCSENEVAESLATHSTIITNSFHGAYWSLLMGKEIVLMGYSSKFESVLRGFDLKVDRFIPINRGCTHSLLDAIESLDIQKHRIRLSDSHDYLHRFRQLNITFAQSLVENKLASGFKRKRVGDK